MSKTVDIKELVKRLRDPYGAGRGNIDAMASEAADALEAMAGEVATVRSARDMHHANYELMKAHNKELFGKLSVAELERDRLKAALEKIANLDPSQEPWAKTFARKALGGDAS